MTSCFYVNQQNSNLSPTYTTAIHALREYRTWRNNTYVGHHLGSARDAYLEILRRRLCLALKAYRAARLSAPESRFCKAA